MSVDFLIEDYCSTFSGEFNLYHDNVRHSSEYFNDVTDITSVQHTFDVDYAPGTWCADFNLHHNGQREFMMQDMPSDRKCWDVVTPPCDVNALMSFDGSYFDEDTGMITIIENSDHSVSHWCNLEDLVFSRTTQAECEGNDPQDYGFPDDTGRQALNYTFDEMDFSKEVCVTVSHTNSKYPDQPAVTDTCCDYVEFFETCRPTIVASEFNMVDVGVTDVQYVNELKFDYQFSGTGLQNCGDMQGTYQIISANGEVFEPVAFTDDELTSAVGTTQRITTNLEQKDDCWSVVIKYGECSTEQDLLVTEQSGRMCHHPKCVITRALNDYSSTQPDGTNDNLVHYFMVGAE